MSNESAGLQHCPPVSGDSPPEAVGGTQSRSSYARRLLGLLTARWPTWTAILAASLVLNLCGLAAPRITQAVFDRVVPTGDFLLLAHFLLLLLVVTIVQLALTVCAGWCWCV